MENNELETFRKLVAEGLTTQMIATAMSHHDRTITRWARKYGLHIGRPWRKVQPPPKSVLQELLTTGISTYKISQKFGASQHTVCRWLSLYGLKAVRRKAKAKQCMICGNSYRRDDARFCGISCYQVYRYNNYIEKWKNGKVSGAVAGGYVSDFIRRYLKETRGDKCQRCGWAERNPITGLVPVQINHKNGNAYDNTETNLELLCPNCHSLTPTYMALNKGNGRTTRYAHR